MAMSETEREITKVDITETDDRKQIVTVYNKVLGIEAEKVVDMRGRSKVARELLTMKAITVCLAELLDQTADMLIKLGMVNDENDIVH